MKRGGPILIFVLLIGACSSESPNTTNTSTPAVTPAGPSPSPLTDFEEALRFVRNGQYTYVYVFSRKDGKALESADNDFLKTNAPQLVDKAATKDRMKLVAGTNFNLEEGNMEALKKRFVVEDYSAR
ncbi:MAG TPA: hypothetical protein VGP98_08160 [Pyrinomonadaceae bacterium]|jgi:hypothetical protein|nr:hypothetical protein [Pyrinomonadaceae bacterium]